MPKVLIVEDDPLIVRLYEKTMTLEGFEVGSADNGLSALEILPTFMPDIILLDIMMPTINGIEFLNKVKEYPASANIPVIVLTNVADNGIILSAQSAGAALVLIKSQTEPDEVVNAVKSILAKKDSQSDVSPDQPAVTT